MEREGDNPEIGAAGLVLDLNHNIPDEKDIDKQLEGELEIENDHPIEPASHGESEVAKKKKRNRNRRKKKTGTQSVEKTKAENETTEQNSEVEVFEKQLKIVSEEQNPEPPPKGSEQSGVLTIGDFPKKKRKKNRNKNQDSSRSPIPEIEKIEEAPDICSASLVEVEQPIHDFPEPLTEFTEETKESVNEIVEENALAFKIEETKKAEDVPESISTSPVKTSTPAPSFTDSPKQIETQVLETADEKHEFGSETNKNPSDGILLPCKQTDEFTQELEDKLMKLAKTSGVADNVELISSDKSLISPNAPHTSVQTIPDIAVAEGNDDIIGFFENIDLWKKYNPMLLKSIKYAIDELIQQAVDIFEKNQLGNCSEKLDDGTTSAQTDPCSLIDFENAPEEKNLDSETIVSVSKSVDENLNFLQNEDSEKKAQELKEVITLYSAQTRTSQEVLFAVESDYGLVKEQPEYVDLLGSGSGSNLLCQDHYPLIKDNWEDRSAPLELKEKIEVSKEDHAKADEIKKQIIANVNNGATPSDVSVEHISTRRSDSSLKEPSTSGKTRRRRSLSRRIADGIRNAFPCIRTQKSLSPSKSGSGSFSPKPNTTLPKIFKR